MTVRRHGWVDRLFVPLPLWLASLISIGLGAGYAATIFSPSFLAGTSPFWRYPQGTIGGGENDMAQALGSYLLMAGSGWTFPLLFSPNLNFPVGLNLFWLDPTPIIGLSGRLFAAATGHVVNLMGPYLFLAIALNGLAMTLLLAAAGQRGMLAVLAGTLIAEATPWMLFRWGHVSMQGTFYVILGLALYLAANRNPRRQSVTLGWLLLLGCLGFVNYYLLAMTAAIWGASWLQRLIDGQQARRHLLVEAIAVVGSVLLLMGIFGVLTPRLGGATSSEYGLYAMDLLSPVVPQRSGVFWPLSQFQLRAYEGFAYLGAGVLLLVLATARVWLHWLRDHLPRHVVLLCVLAGMLLFAISSRLHVADAVILELPLPALVKQTLGLFRASGRFFWPVGYAVMAGAVLAALSLKRRTWAVSLLSTAAVLQLIDVEPLRRSIAASVRQIPSLTIDEARVGAAMTAARVTLVFPTFGCVIQNDDPGAYTRVQRETLLRAIVELQLMAARRNRPINSFYSGRRVADCSAEETLARGKLEPGRLYIYLDGTTPSADQLSGRLPSDVCTFVGGYRYCAIPG